MSDTFAHGAWPALHAGYFVGGRTTVDDVENGDEQEGVRFGATLALPVSRHHSVTIYTVTGCNAHRDHNMDANGIAWQVRRGCCC